MVNNRIISGPPCINRIDIVSAIVNCECIFSLTKRAITSKHSVIANGFLTRAIAALFNIEPLRYCKIGKSLFFKLYCLLKVKSCLEVAYAMGKN